MTYDHIKEKDALSLEPNAFVAVWDYPPLSLNKHLDWRRVYKVVDGETIIVADADHARGIISYRDIERIA